MNWSWRIAQYGAPLWPRAVMLLVIVLATVGLEILQPWPTKLAIDYVLAGKPMPSVWAWLEGLNEAATAVGLLIYLALAIMAIFIVQQLTNVFKDYVSADLGERLTYLVGGELFDVLQRRSRTFHGRHNTGDLVQRVTTDATCLRDLLLSAVLPVVSSMLMLAGILAIVWAIDWMMALVALFAALPMAVAIRYFAGPMSERSYELQQVEGRRLAMAEQTLSSVPVVQAFGREPHEQQRFDALGAQSLGAYLRALSAQLWFKGSVDTATAFGMAGMMLFGGLRALQGAISIGDLYLFLVYLTALYGPLQTMAYLASGVATIKAKSRRVLEVLDESDPLRDPDNPTILRGPVEGSVTFEAVTVGYRKGEPVLDSLDLDVPPGQRVALVGASGAGKSTLVSLLPRFLDPWSGRVLLDGVDVRQLKRRDLRSHVAWLDQDAVLMPISIAENIAYGRPDASRESVVKAARAADAHDFIEALSQGYDTVVGERGTTLSGGQRQRIAIARALLTDAAVVVMDEPTSALDAETEEQVMSAIERLTAGRTTFVVAHRLSTVRRADRILVLEDGHIREQGTHDALIARGGLYTELTMASRF